MSLTASRAVWEHTQRPKQTALLVLLALADRANDSGGCWPAVSTIAAMVGTSERHVRRVLVELETSGWVARTERPGRPTFYRITPPTPDTQVSPDVEVSPDTQVRDPGHPGPKPLTPRSGAPDTQVSRTTSNHQGTSKGTSSTRATLLAAGLAPEEYLAFIRSLHADSPGGLVAHLQRSGHLAERIAEFREAQAVQPLDRQGETLRRELERAREADAASAVPQIGSAS